MRVRVQALLANYELRPWELRAWVDDTDAPEQERVLVHSQTEALALLRRLIAEDPLASLRHLVAEVADVGNLDHDWLDMLAAHIVRGWIIVTRSPIEIMASEPRTRDYELVYEPSEQSGIRPEVGLRVSFNYVQPPAMGFVLEIEPPVTIVPSMGIEPPAIPEPDFQVTPPFTMIAEVELDESTAA
jgi:hypothetical protein